MWIIKATQAYIQSPFHNLVPKEMCTTGNRSGRMYQDYLAAESCGVQKAIKANSYWILERISID